MTDINAWNTSDSNCKCEIHTFLDPPKRRQATAFLTSVWPNIDGATMAQSLVYESGL